MAKQEKGCYIDMLLQVAPIAQLESETPRLGGLVVSQLITIAINNNDNNHDNSY